MKKAAVLILCLLPLLCGCGRLRAQSREVEQLRLAETLGLDPAPEGLCLSLAAPGGGGEESLFVSASGPTVDMAMEALRERSAEQELFCGHLQHILLGEAFAEQGLDALLAAVCRSPDLRVDMPVYLLLDAAARDAMEQAGDGETGVCDLLNGLSVRGTGLSSAGRILRDLDRQGSALIRALKQEDSPEARNEAKVLVPWGFGVLAGDRLLARISPEDAPAVELLTGELQPGPLLLRDGRGRRVTLELLEGQTELLPLWDESGELEGLEIRVRAEAAVLEIQGFSRAADSRTLEELNARLEETLTRRIVRVLGLSRELRADFLGLGRRLELLAPRRCRGLSRELGELLPELRLCVTVRGELRHSHDLN